MAINCITGNTVLQAGSFPPVRVAPADLGVGECWSRADTLLGSMSYACFCAISSRSMRA